MASGKYFSPYQKGGVRMKFLSRLLMTTLLGGTFLFGDAVVNATTADNSPATQSTGEFVAKKDGKKGKGKGKKGGKKGAKGKGKGKGKGKSKKG
jgi:hypothetical protein